MTPTLLGRWQIRLFLLGTIGVIIALLVGFLVKDIRTPFIILGFVFVQGVILDLLYQYIVTFRWDRDWPTSFQVAAAIIEGAILWVLIATGKLPGVPSSLHFVIFLAQYGITWLIIFMLTQGALRVFSPDWHYQGGQWLVFRQTRYQAAPPQQQGFQQPLTIQPPFQQPAAQAQQTPIPVQQAPVPVQQVGNVAQSRPGFTDPSPRQPQWPSGPAQQPARTPQQQPGPVPQTADVFQSRPVQQPSDPQPVLRQPVARTPQTPHPFKCVCGYADEKMTGQFCPRCGRPATNALN